MDSIRDELDRIHRQVKWENDVIRAGTQALDDQASQIEDLSSALQFAKEQIAELKKENARLTRRIQSVRVLCEEAEHACGIGCLCYGDECKGTCGGWRTTGWTLDPATVCEALGPDVS